MSNASSITASASYALTASQPIMTPEMGSMNAAQTNTTQNIDAVSKDFEAVFLSQMMEAMFSGDDLTSFFGGGTTGDVYKSYLLNEYGKAFAQAGGVGIAASVKQELLKLQEAA